MTANQIAYLQTQNNLLLGLSNLQENVRHNIATEQLTKESQRLEKYRVDRNLDHSYYQSGLNYEIDRGKLLETFRHNITQEMNARLTLDETVRANKARESFNILSLQEQARHNKVGEGVAQEQLYENVRHNRATEGLSEKQIGLGYANVQLGYSNLKESQRHNIRTEFQNMKTFNLNAKEINEKYGLNVKSANNWFDSGFNVLRWAWNNWSN